MAQFRSPDPADYPELAGYTRDGIYFDSFGGGAMWDVRSAWLQSSAEGRAFRKRTVRGDAVLPHPEESDAGEPPPAPSH
ncbi:MAG: hypothetical protein ABSD48_03140 [Armatimonadota bacterium]